MGETDLVGRFGCASDTDSNRAMRAAHESFKNANLAKYRTFLFPHFSRLVVRNRLKVPKRGQFHAANRVTPKRCDLCAQAAPERRTVLW